VSQSDRVMFFCRLYFAKSRNVNENGRPIIRKLGFGFLFAFHGKYDRILYHFRDKVRYWSKLAVFITPAFDAPVMGSPSEYIVIMFYVKN